MIAARETCHALGCRTSRSTCARSSAAPSSTRSSPPTRVVRRRIRAAAATASSASPSCSTSPTAPAGTLWTGHYARIVERDGRMLLARAADPEKDQSYMLAPLDPAARLERVVPARRADQGGDTQRGRRRRPRGRGAAREPGGVLPRRRRLPGVPRAPGARADRGRDRRRGRTELGRHDGVWRYTPGQRRGIGIAAAEPLYAALGRDYEHARRPARVARLLGSRGARNAPRAGGRRRGKLRYRSPALPARVTETATASRSSSPSRRTASRRARSRRSTTTTR